ncbi:hypothetical protein Bpfe_010290, partial [Biomphalaria pfeifferi]
MIRRASSHKDLGPGSEAASTSSFGVPLSPPTWGASSASSPEAAVGEVRKDVG